MKRKTISQKAYMVPPNCIKNSIGMLLPRIMSEEASMKTMGEFFAHILKCEMCLTMSREAERLGGRTTIRPSTTGEWTEFLNSYRFKKFR